MEEDDDYFVVFGNLNSHRITVSHLILTLIVKESIRFFIVVLVLDLILFKYKYLHCNLGYRLYLYESLCNIFTLLREHGTLNRN